MDSRSKFAEPPEFAHLRSILLLIFQIHFLSVRFTWWLTNCYLNREHITYDGGSVYNFIRFHVFRMRVNAHQMNVNLKEKIIIIIIHNSNGFKSNQFLMIIIGPKQWLTWTMNHFSYVYYFFFSNFQIWSGWHSNRVRILKSFIFPILEQNKLIRTLSHL